MFPNLNKFIAEKVLDRGTSFFLKDIENNKDELESRIGGKNVLVIGGGGTIGSNYIKSLLPFRPQSVIIVDSNENGLTELVRDIHSTRGLKMPATFITYPVNFGDPLFSKIYAAYKPFDIVANFAAHKHVRSEKDIFSIEAMIQNNLLHAHNLLQLVVKDKPSHFFCVSTDKAANPVNVMGATKKLMEDLVMSFAAEMNCTTARFANVAFSNGSLPDGFIRRLLSRQPLSVPKDVKRYFVSPAESGEICMLASVLGNTGDIFFPNFKESMLTGFYEITVKFLAEAGFDILECDTEEKAKEFASGMAVNSPVYPVYTFSSDTTGEKLYEEFYLPEESPDFSRFQTLGVVNPLQRLQPENNLSELFTTMADLFNRGDAVKADIVKLLKQYIPTFSHHETGKTLDMKM